MFLTTSEYKIGAGILGFRALSITVFAIPKVLPVVVWFHNHLMIFFNVDLPVKIKKTQNNKAKTIAALFAIYR